MYGYQIQVSTGVIFHAQLVRKGSGVIFIVLTLQILKPMMLRRLKEDVEKSLAPKEETIVEVRLLCDSYPIKLSA